jgi:hypothetical protein
MAYRKNGLRMEDLFSVKVDGIDFPCSNQELEGEFTSFGDVQDV